MTNRSGQLFKKTVRDVALKGKTVLVRADYNVPMKDGEIADDFRIRSSLLTLNYLHDEGAKVVIISHLGRPDGKPNEKFSLEPVAARLAALLDHKVEFVPECTGDVVKQAVKHSSAHSFTMLQNVRYHAEEEENDDAFARDIAKSTGATLFVQDGFGVVHRAHASTSAITHHLPSVAGLLLEKEYTRITQAVENPKRPLVAVLGGAKVSDKVAIIERLVGIADTILIGGAMANTFLKYKGLGVGASKVESVDAVLAGIYHKAARKVGKDKVDQFIVLPVDVVTAHEASATAPTHVKTADGMTSGDMAFDVGPATAKEFSARIAQAHTILWNGTLGYAEFAAFAEGSRAVATAIVSNSGATSVVGGGDTADFALKWQGDKRGFTHVSTGGGAGLELMAGDKLPGIEALLDA